jgi:hypothetical protein
LGIWGWWPPGGVFVVVVGAGFEAAVEDADQPVAELAQRLAAPASRRLISYSRGVSRPSVRSPGFGAYRGRWRGPGGQGRDRAGSWSSCWQPCARRSGAGQVPTAASLDSASQAESRIAGITTKTDSIYSMFTRRRAIGRLDGAGAAARPTCQVTGPGPSVAAGEHDEVTARAGHSPEGRLV